MHHLLNAHPYCQRAQRSAVREAYKKGNADPNKVRVLGKAAQSVRESADRIWSGDQLEKCKFIGAQFRAVSLGQSTVLFCRRPGALCKKS